MLNKYLKYVNKLKQYGGASYSLSENKLLDIFDRCLQNDFIDELGPFLNLKKSFRMYKSMWEYTKNIRYGNKRKTALMYAARVGDLERVRFLLSVNADVNLEGVAGWVSILPENLANQPNGVYFGYDSIALKEACQFNHLAIVQELCNHGAIINPPITKLRYNISPLIIASANGYIELVRYLISRGAILNIFSNGRTAEKSFGITSGGYTNMTPLKFACKYNKLDVLRELVDSGVVITPDEIESLVTYANANNNIDIIEYLTTRAVNNVDALLDQE